jgi:parallel beta-helix repeat protein
MKVSITLRFLLATVLFAVALVQTGVGVAAEGVLYVDRGNPSCSDSGTGLLTQPFCTIGAAAKKVAAGQTVQVASGTYPEAVSMVTSGTSTSPISFTTAPGATVTVSGKANGFSVLSRSWISVSGFNVTNTTSYGIVAKNSAHITLAHNRVSYSGKPVSGSTRFGIRLENTVDSLVERNTVHHNTDAGIAVLYGSTGNHVRSNHAFQNARGYVRAAPGIRLYYAPGNIVYGNVSHHNEDSGIECYTDADDCSTTT